LLFIRTLWTGSINRVQRELGQVAFGDMPIACFDASPISFAVGLDAGIVPA
jgi:hypothetical protein